MSARSSASCSPVQIAEMAAILGSTAATAPSTWSKPAPATAACRPTSCERCDAGDPRAATRARGFTSSRRAPRPAPRSAGTLGGFAGRAASASAAICPERSKACSSPTSCSTRMPVHQVVMREEGCTRCLSSNTRGRLAAREGAPSTPALGAYLGRARRRPRARLARRNQPARARLGIATLPGGCAADSSSSSTTGTRRRELYSAYACLGAR